MFEWIIAVVLGVVEGITEFMPVSSTGHLILVGHLLRFTGERADCFEVFIQFGAILAVVVLYRDRFLALIPGRKASVVIGSDGSIASNLADASNSNAFAGRHGLLLLAVVTAPGLVFGKLLHHTIKAHLFSPLTVAVGLGVGGVLILLVEKFAPKAQKAGLNAFTWKDALVIGFFQCLALWPGMSRASSTLLGGMLLGFDRKSAAEFSFLAAVPLITAAALYDLYKSLPFLHAQDAGLFAVGFVVSFAAAWVAVRFFIQYLSRHTLSVFGYYRIVLALMAGWMFSRV
jgi:undecaprenyl-diphosphatase